MNIIRSDNVFRKVFHYNYLSFCVYVTYMRGCNCLLGFISMSKKKLEIEASYVD